MFGADKRNRKQTKTFLAIALNRFLLEVYFLQLRRPRAEGDPEPSASCARAEGHASNPQTRKQQAAVKQTTLGSFHRIITQ